MRRGRRQGLGDFTPGLESAKAAGIKMERAPYPAGDEGIQLSLETVARRVREGAIDPRIGELAHKIFTAAGFSGRGASAGSTRERIHSILEYVRGWLIYAPDPPGTERIASAAALACVQPGLCLRLSDCDDCVVLTGSLLGSAGIPVRIVKQDYGSGHQQHVLLEAFDDGAGTWLYADPSTDMPLGTAAHAASEQRIDPLDLTVTGEGSSGAEIITLGRPHMSNEMTMYEGRWWHRDGLGRVSFHDGSSWHPVPQTGVGSFIKLQQDVREQKNRIDPYVRSTNEDVTRWCASVVPQGVKDAWSRWYQSWDSYFNAPDAWWGSAADWDRGAAYEEELRGWQDRLKQLGCVNSSPIVVPEKSPELLSQGTQGTLEAIAKVILVTGATAGGLYALYLFAPAIRRALDSKSGKSEKGSKKK